MPDDNVAELERLLLTVSARFGETLRLDELLPTVLDAFVHVLDAERAAVVLFDARGRMERAVTHAIPWDRQEDLPVSNTVLGHVRRTGRPVVVPDAGRDTQVGKRPSVRLHELRMLVGVPVPGRGGVAGVLYADSKLEARWSQAPHLALLEALGRLVSTALENSRLYEEQRSRARMLEQMVHDLRGPLQVQLFNTDLLLEELPGGELYEVARDMHASARHAVGIIDLTLQLARAEHGLDLDPVEVSLAELVPAHLASLHRMVNLTGLRLELDVPADLPPVRSAPGLLRMVLDNLVGNAIKHARRGTPVRVVARRRDDAGPVEARARDIGGPLLFHGVQGLRPQPAAGFLQIDVHNQGAAMPPAWQARVFEPFSRGTDAGGAGLGLALVAECASVLGGCVWVSSAEGDGTTFSVTLPLALAGSTDAVGG